MKKLCFILMLLLLTLCACEGQTAQTTDVTDPTTAVTTTMQTAEVTTDAVTETTEVTVTAPERDYFYLSEVDFSEYKDAMTADAYAALASYIPVLQGEKTFVWQSSWLDRTAQEVDISDFHAALWEGKENPSAELMPDRFTLLNIVGDDDPELILWVRDIGYHQLVLHLAEDGTYYGIDYPIRWFEPVGYGVYSVSGGVASGSYYALRFADGAFAQEKTAEWDNDNGTYFLNGEAVEKTAFDSWEKALNISDPKWIECKK